MKKPSWEVKIKGSESSQAVYMRVEGRGSSLEVLVAQGPVGIIIAVPNFGVAANGSTPDDFSYNAEALSQEGLNEIDARTVAAAIATLAKKQAS